MEGLQDLKVMLDRNGFMASIDISDAFYSIPLHPIGRNYVTFYFNNQRYTLNALPIGLTSSQWIFCIIMHPLLIHLRSQGLRSWAYMDDIFLWANSSSYVIVLSDWDGTKAAWVSSVQS